MSQMATVAVDPAEGRHLARIRAMRISEMESGEVVKSREMYFAIYEALAEDERRAGLFREFTPDFFDLIIVDECHRGSARATARGASSSITFDRRTNSA